MKDELVWCKKYVKERWKDLVTAQKLYEDGKNLPEKYEKIGLPFVDEEVSSGQFFPILKKFLKISFGENSSMISIIKDGEKVMAMYYEPVKNCVIQDFKEYHPKTKEEAKRILKELKPEFVKIVDVKFAELLFNNLKNKKTDERFIATFLTLLYSLKKGYVAIKPAKNIFKLIYFFANLMEINNFDIPNINLPLSYELVSDNSKVKVKNNIITASINVDKIINILTKINEFNNTKEIIRILSKEGIRLLKSDGITIKNALGAWKVLKHYIKDMDENLFERFEDFASQIEKAIILIGKSLVFIEMEDGLIQKITINKKKGTNEEILNEFWEKYGYIDAFVEIRKNNLKIPVFKLIVPKIDLPNPLLFLPKLLKALPDIIRS